MKLFGTIKDNKGVRFYLFGLKLYEERKLPHARKTYVFGIRTKKKSRDNKPGTAPANLSMQQKIEWRARLAFAEQKILTLGLYYKDMPKEERYIICFDYLEYPYAESIDAWTFFQYLQSLGIPSKYVVRRENGLFKKLQDSKELKDIIPVSNEMQLLTDYPNIIAQSRMVVCSFNFELSSSFKQFPFLRFIFIEHGVTLLKEWTSRWYMGEKFDGKLVPTVPTKRHYEDIGFNFESCTPYYCGMPRWDNLPPAARVKKQRKIFLFFTGRLSFRRGVEKRYENRQEYMNRMLSFINRLKDLIADKNQISLYISLHHSIYEHDNHFNGQEQLKDVSFVPMTEISSMVKEADMCITDFSSISFDFLYRDVPVIFYCFDTDIDYPNVNDRIKWAADKIDLELYNGCRCEEAAVSLAKHYIDRDFQLEDEFVKKNEEIFWERGNNCRRLWQMLNEEE